MNRTEWIIFWGVLPLFWHAIGSDPLEATFTGMKVSISKILEITFVPRR